MADVMTEERTWTAKHRFARIAPRKARLVMGLIRDLPCKDAMDVLRFEPRRAAGLIATVVKSAMSNANEDEADMNRLHVVEARVDGNILDLQGSHVEQRRETRPEQSPHPPPEQR